MNRLLMILALLLGLSTLAFAGAPQGFYSNDTVVTYRKDPVSGALQWRWGAWAIVNGDLQWVWTVWGSCTPDPKEPGTALKADPLDHPVLQLPSGKAQRSQRINRGRLSQLVQTPRGSQWVIVPPAPKEQSRPNGGSTVNMGIDEDGGTAPRNRKWL